VTGGLPLGWAAATRDSIRLQETARKTDLRLMTSFTSRGLVEANIRHFDCQQVIRLHAGKQSGNGSDFVAVMN
jgi:hypothetical protein